MFFFLILIILLSLLNNKTYVGSALQLYMPRLKEVGHMVGVDANVVMVLVVRNCVLAICFHQSWKSQGITQITLGKPFTTCIVWVNIGVLLIFFIYK
jgi:hypothetical protein